MFGSRLIFGSHFPFRAARRMGWKETNVNEQVGKDGGPIETKESKLRT
jgi:hypothetical protein